MSQRHEPSPSHGCAMGPSLSRDAGEGLSCTASCCSPLQGSSSVRCWRCAHAPPRAPAISITRRRAAGRSPRRAASGGSRRRAATLSTALASTSSTAAIPIAPRTARSITAGRRSPRLSPTGSPKPATGCTNGASTAPAAGRCRRSSCAFRRSSTSNSAGAPNSTGSTRSRRQTERRMMALARKLVAPYRGSPYRIGYFSDNEVGWWAGALFVYYSKQPASFLHQAALGRPVAPALPRRLGRVRRRFRAARRASIRGRRCWPARR